MMHILFSPQRSDKTITYSFDGEVITANGTEYDFSQFTDDGKLKEPPHPIVKAERVDGELYVTLINYIGKDATEEERFPDWQVID